MYIYFKWFLNTGKIKTCGGHLFFSDGTYRDVPKFKIHGHYDSFKGQKTISWAVFPKLGNSHLNSPFQKTQGCRMALNQNFLVQ